MRKDVENEISYMRGDKLLNKSELARRMGCDRRTVGKYLSKENENETESEKEKNKNKRKYKSKLDKYKTIIIEKVDKYGASSKAVTMFLKEKGYEGSYGIVNKFIMEHKNEEIKKATMRFETTPGLQAQVDWKEKVIMVTKENEKMEVNIFLMVLGYSRLKFLKLTSDKTQKTLFECMFEALKFFDGVPHEILFDNMTTVVDRAKTAFSNVRINEKFNYFAIDSGFSIITCRTYRPQTKGKIESVARLVSRLKVYNEEFENFNELEEITNKFNILVNNEICQSTNELPIERFQKEKEYLKPLPRMEILVSYFWQEKEYKITKESMATYKGKKYSVPTYYIGKSVTIKETETLIEIYSNTNIVSTHKKSENFLNYKEEHLIEILKSDAMKHNSDDEIEDFVYKKLKDMDNFL